MRLSVCMVQMHDDEELREEVALNLEPEPFPSSGYYGRPFEARNKVGSGNCLPGVRDWLFLATTSSHSDLGKACAHLARMRPLFVPPASQGQLLHSACAHFTPTPHRIAPHRSPAASQQHQHVPSCPQPKGSSFTGENKDFYRFKLGEGKVIPAFEEAVAGMKVGGDAAAETSMPSGRAGACGGA